MTVEGAHSYLHFSLYRDTHGIWHAHVRRDDGEFDAMARSPEQALISLWQKVPSAGPQPLPGRFLQELLGA